MINDSINVVSEFDRLVGALEGLPDVTKSKPSTLRAMLPLVGIARSYIVQTYRHREQGDTIFLETVGGEGSVRIAIPPQVADAIARQREGLTGKVRSKIARQVAADRKARGVMPAFLLEEHRGKAKKARAKKAKARKARKAFLVAKQARPQAEEASA
jgi:hypothetical protein